MIIPLMMWYNFMIIIIIIIMHDIPYHYNDIPIFAAAPEVTMDQQWRSAQDGAVQVKIDCTVHSNPPSQVIMMNIMMRTMMVMRMMLLMIMMVVIILLLVMMEMGKVHSSVAGPLAKVEKHLSR